MKTKKPITQNQTQTQTISTQATRTDRVRVRRTLLKSTAAGLALTVWHKPLINTVLLPAHAQTSVAPVMCAMIRVENVLFGPVSGSNTPPVCSVTFDLFSADATEDVTISAVDTSALAAGVTVSVQDLGTATSTRGPRVVWRGPASDAPFCTDLMPTDDVTFTITSTCSAATNGETFTQTFTLLSILQ